MWDGGHCTKTLLDKLRKERENAKRSRRTEEEKANPSVGVLEACFPRHQKRAMAKCNVVSQIEASAMVHSKGCQADTLGQSDQIVLKMLRHDIIDCPAKMTKVKVF